MMDLISGGSGSVGDDNGEASQNENRRSECERRTTYQREYLEGYYKDYPHPNVEQRVRLSEHLGLDPNQIKFWFQNRRTQTKRENEKAQNNALQQEHQELLLCNSTLKEKLQSRRCFDCDELTTKEEQAIQMLKIENESLQKKVDLLSNITSSRSNIGHNFEVIAEGTSLGQRTQGTIRNDMSQYQYTESEKEALIDMSIKARNELLELLRLEEPMWIKSQYDQSSYLNQNIYESTFSSRNHPQISSMRREASKDKGFVAMPSVQLINMFMNVDTWMELFPEIVTKAEIVGTIEGPGCTIYLMYEKTHTLSPLVTPRECVFMRQFHQLDETTWMMVDVSYGDFMRYVGPISSLSWKLPSGCIISHLTDAYSEVTWVEHVQVEDRYLTLPIYWSLIGCSQAYGARRWILTLQKMCERFQALTIERNMPPTDPNYEWNLGSKQRMLEVSTRMVKSFCKALSMEDELGAPYFYDLENGKIRSSFSSSFGPGQPLGLVMRAVASFMIPIPFETVFHTITDKTLRPQWDILSNGGPVCEIAHITAGNYSDISVFQPNEKGPGSNNMVILQETLRDNLGGMLIFTPMRHDTLQHAIFMEDEMIPILPSGFVFSGDGRNHKVSTTQGSSSGAPSNNIGSILTVAFQFLLSDGTSSNVEKKSFDMAKSIFSSTVHKIKVILGCP